VITFVIAAALLASGWFYACDVREWCGMERSEGVSVTDALATAKTSSESPRADTTDSTPTKEKSEERKDKESTEDRESSEKKESSESSEKTSSTCEPYLTKDIRPGGRNDTKQVIKLEKFLNTYEGEKLVEGGVYDGTDQAAVKRFQEKYAKDILTPAGLSRGNGLVLSGTRAKINELYCAAQTEKQEKKTQ